MTGRSSRNMCDFAFTRAFGRGAEGRYIHRDIPGM
jgi:hypothetical protein